jgi:hypothetical protein
MYVIPGSLVCFAAFFFNIERKYLHTFWSSQRGNDLTMSHFLEGTSEETRFQTLTYSRHHWVSIEDKIKKWIEENWGKWDEENPAWFTDHLKALVPVEFIPTTGEARRRESVRRASVGAEAEGGLAGAFRASMRRASVELGVGIGKARVVPTSEGAN